MSVENNQRQDVETFEVRKEVVISAPIQVSFEAMLEQLGPGGEMPNGQAYPFKLEAWPGGRWYRDLGNNSGHLWGFVQVIKPPTLLEIWGPLMMSSGAAVNHLQYRLTEEGKTTRLAFVHRAMGQIEPQHREGMPKGWEHWAKKIAERAEKKAKR
jgi:uncharacterized protein YndB with AHSA1/START domain